MWERKCSWSVSTVPSQCQWEFRFAGYITEEKVHKDRWLCTTGCFYSGLRCNVWIALAKCKNTFTFTLGWYSECATPFIVHILIVHLVGMCIFLFFPKVRLLLQIVPLIPLSTSHRTRLLIIRTSLVTVSSCSTVMSQPLYTTAR